MAKPKTVKIEMDRLDPADRVLVETIQQFVREKGEKIDKSLIRFEEKAKRISGTHASLGKRLELFIKGSIKYQTGVNDTLDELLQTFKKIQSVHEQTEECMMNILLAVRQNEYLQAWYPAQKGHPETKVVGCHPDSVDQRIKKEKYEKCRAESFND